MTEYTPSKADLAAYESEKKPRRSTDASACRVTKLTRGDFLEKGPCSISSKAVISANEGDEPKLKNGYELNIDLIQQENDQSKELTNDGMDCSSCTSTFGSPTHSSYSPKQHQQQQVSSPERSQNRVVQFLRKMRFQSNKNEWFRSKTGGRALQPERSDCVMQMVFFDELLESSPQKVSSATSSEERSDKVEEGGKVLPPGILSTPTSNPNHLDTMGSSPECSSPHSETISLSKIVHLSNTQSQSKTLVACEQEIQDDRNTCPQVGGVKRDDENLPVDSKMSSSYFQNDYMLSSSSWSSKQSRKATAQVDRNVRKGLVQNIPQEPTLPASKSEGEAMPNAHASSARRLSIPHEPITQSSLLRVPSTDVIKDAFGSCESISARMFLEESSENPKEEDLTFSVEGCQTHSPINLEVLPNMFMNLRSALETLHAIESNSATSVTCVQCNATLKCVADVDFVMCPDCRVLTPAEDDEKEFRVVGRGVGLGLKLLGAHNQVHILHTRSD